MTIGVFDSGIGGLTVLRAVQAQLPAADIVYLGDTARLPYGTKSPDTVIAYARQAAGYLHRYNISALVVACNTATAHALTALQHDFTDIPVIGVIESGAQAAARHARVLVLATEGTIASGAYQRAIAVYNPQCEVVGLPAGLLVALAEEGWMRGVEAEAVIRRYLAPYLLQPPTAIVLGCTHFPLLEPAIRAVVGEGVAIINSASTTAQALAATLGAVTGRGRLQLLATDNPARFVRVASVFLERSVQASDVQLIDLAPHASLVSA